MARRRVLIDADTANEIDDLYAIVRALYEPSFHIVGLTSAQWNHRLSPPDTVRESQLLNEDILQLTGHLNIPHPMGAEMIFGRPWGGDEPRDSPAARLMIEEARATPEDKRLTIVNLGAATNVASAIKLAPDIIPRISCYNLAGRFYPDRAVWDKDEFNVRNDLNAANFLFNTEGLDLHIMPVTPLRHFTLNRNVVVERLGGQGGIWDYLVARWMKYAPRSENWVIWDLALIIALVRPQMATEIRAQTPPENVQREIGVYTEVDIDAMRADWWETVERAKGEGQRSKGEGQRAKVKG